MFSRLGFVGRITAILLFAVLALLTAAGAWTYVAERTSPPRHVSAVLPKQAAAIIDLLESLPDDQRGVVLQSVNSDALAVSVVLERPAVPHEARQLPGVEWLISNFNAELAGREVIVVLDPAEISAWQRTMVFPQITLSQKQPLRLAVSLKPSGYVVFETQGEVVRKLFGLPPGFWLGVLGSIVGIAALQAIGRQAAPLNELAQSVTKFTGSAIPPPVKPRGAPEIVSLIRSVQDMQERIAALIKGRSVFLGAVSHDLKTYLTRLRLRTELLENEEQRLKASRDLDDMSALLDDTLAFARGHQGPERREQIDLADLLSGLALEREDVELTENTTTSGVFVYGDPVAMRRLFSNLIENAVRYGVRARVAISRGGDTVAVTIDDDGPGIPESERENVFEPFYRLETSRNRGTGGTGLGLAIAKQIVEAHDGTLSISQAPSGGARAIVRLPTAFPA